MNFKQIESFLWVADLQSFTKAARQLYMSQPAVSFQIKALEEDLAVLLFKRGDKKIVLTDAGQLLYREAKQMFLHYQKMKVGLDDLKGLKTGQLTVGAGTIPGEYLLPLLIGDFLKIYPGVRIDLRIAGSGQVANWLLNREVDVGFTGACVEGNELEYSLWLEDELQLIVPSTHQWAKQKFVNGADLQGECFIFREKGSGTRCIVEEKLNGLVSLEQMPQGPELGSSKAIVTAVEAGLGVSIVSRYAAQDALALGRIKTVRLMNVDLNRGIYQVHHKQSIGGFVMKTFMEHIYNHEVCAKYGLKK